MCGWVCLCTHPHVLLHLSGQRRLNQGARRDVFVETNVSGFRLRVTISHKETVLLCHHRQLKPLTPTLPTCHLTLEFP